MDIEAIVKKHARLADGMRYWDAELLLRAALTEMAAGYEQRLNKIQSNDLMAECMEQTRSDLIAAGVIDKTCAPMFLADAVISRVRNLEQKDYTGGDAELLRERIRQLSETHAIEMRASEATVQNQAERIRQLEAERVPSPSCRECANRGRVNGLAQEIYCDSCVRQGQSFRVNHYAPQPNKEGG